jgi:hypothetical protein
MFVIATLVDVRCLREAHVVPAMLLDEIELHLRACHRQSEKNLPVDDCSLTANGLIVILQPGDGPGVYQLLTIPDSPVETHRIWNGRGNFGQQVRFRVLHLRVNQRTVTLYIPTDVLDQATR